MVSSGTFCAQALFYPILLRVGDGWASLRWDRWLDHGGDATAWTSVPGVEKTMLAEKMGGEAEEVV
jgi:hypothetical protein